MLKLKIMKKILLIVFAAMVVISCGNGGGSPLTNVDNSGSDTGTGDGSSTGDGSGTDNNSGGTLLDWLVPANEVRDGGPGKDGIPSLDNPVFANVADIDPSFIKDDDLVIGIVKNGVVKAYPHFILNWHEIVNDKFGLESTTISFCPLTGTSFAWKSVAAGKVTSFGVSGLLYNNNLIMYDRDTDTYWSQLRVQAIHGKLKGNKPELRDVVETNWKTWKTLYPNTQILTTDTGFSRSYNIYPYGDYLTNQNFLLFPVSPLNNNLPNKERVYALMGEANSNNPAKSIVFRFSGFTGGKALKQTFEGEDYLIVGNENLINSFELTPNQAALTYTFSFTDSEGFFTDSEGTEWNVFGKAISGPKMGNQLRITKSVVSYWFAIGAFYPNPEIVQ